MHTWHSVIVVVVLQANSELQKRDQNEWDKVFQHLLQTLRSGITLCIEQGLLGEQEKDIFFMSGMHITETIDIVYTQTNYLCQRGYVFVGLCLFVCLCVSKITRKVMDRSSEILRVCRAWHILPVIQFWA